MKEGSLMSMVVDAAVPARVDIAYWDEHLSGREDVYELVEGIPTMAAAESNVNRAAGALLVGALNVHRAGWLAAMDLEVTLAEVPPTVRRPDVVVAVNSAVTRDRAPLPTNRVFAHEVLLVAEVVSPTSVERDLVTKRREYALAGIPAYLLVDLRSEPGELALYAERDADGRYVEVAPTQRVEVGMDGTVIPIEVADLLV